MINWNIFIIIIQYLVSLYFYFGSSNQNLKLIIQFDNYGIKAKKSAKPIFYLKFKCKNVKHLKLSVFLNNVLP